VSDKEPYNVRVHLLVHIYHC